MAKFRKDRELKPVKTTHLEKVPPARKEWDRRTKALFKKVCLDLIARGRLEDVTVHAVNQYCDCFYIYRLCMDEIFSMESLTTKDRNADRKNPVFGTAKSFLEQMNVLEKKLGYTPYSRDRISQADTNEDVDPFDEM